MRAKQTSPPTSEGDQQPALRELTKEKLSLDPATHSITMSLLDKEIARLQNRKDGDLDNMVDLCSNRPIKGSVKVSVPVKEHPTFNFVGKLLGNEGKTLKRLQEETMTKMAIRGRGSIRDKNKEAVFRASLDPKYAHLSDDLHVYICAVGHPVEVRARLANAMDQIRKYLVPDDTEDIVHPEGGGPGCPGGFCGSFPVPHPGAAADGNKVKSIFDKARICMEGGFGGPSREGQGGYGYDLQTTLPSYGSELDYGPGAAGPQGVWRGGPNAPGAGSSRFPPRPAPYNRPPM